MPAILEEAYLSVIWSLCVTSRWGRGKWGLAQCFSVLLELLSWCWWWVDMLWIVLCFHFYHTDNKPCVLLWELCCWHPFSTKTPHSEMYPHRRKANSPHGTDWANVLNSLGGIVKGWLFNQMRDCSELLLLWKMKFGIWLKKKNTALKYKNMNLGGLSTSVYDLFLTPWMPTVRFK